MYGLRAALQVRAATRGTSSIRASPRRVGLAIGTVLIIVGALVLLLWIPLRQWPGFGTVSNVVLIGVAEPLAPGSADGARPWCGA